MISAWKAFCAPIPQRWVFAVMGFLGIVNTYAMRGCISLAITEMVIVDTHSGNRTFGESLCQAPNDTTSSNSSSGGTFDWDESLQGLILSAFYWGYIITHIPGGMLAEIFGGKYVLGLGILLSAVLTVLTPLVVEWGDATGLIVLRFVAGLGEGTTYPALNSLLAHWTPPSERTLMGSLVFAGAQIGTVFSSTVSGLLLADSPIGWRSVFYFFGGITIFWFLVFVVLCYDTPENHPFLSDNEKKFLHDQTKAHTHKNIQPTPWRYILRSQPLWALVCAQIGHDWGLFTMLTDLPSYMSRVLHFSVKSNGLLSAVPYIAMWFVSLLAARVADWLRNSGRMSITNIRKLFTTLGSMGPAVFLIAASYAGCDRIIVIVLFTIGMGFMGNFYPGMKVNALDLSPNYAGALMAIVNGIGAISGIITPYLVGSLTSGQTVGEWRLVFWIVFGVFTVTNVIYIFFASGEVQEWNDPDFLIRKQEARKNKTAG